ncbi:hypothetical protein A2116_02110 [Candidatus Jorgensenbacteria bacterium GWA1_49_17]|uniref:Uncharacterized protein n=2 Tax=Candidatus Joergenseniibacteriota TaxID=1752739 RepID=A0A1F6BQ45_9BACT|nr:MAG: hypothetical protein A2127_02625 [Candidatus Jorgensenbacteria bacterium GWC1_48_12]OGG39861.1 MAG: hypothetical protein A2116_02110 [Candidatus Jorgensenbacteria bacterium GWA1_49_17]
MEDKKTITILVFLQGTLIMHKNAAGLSRGKIIRQVIDQEDSVRDFKSYIPIGNAPQELRKWAEQGAKIRYLSALTENKKGRGDEIVGKEGLRADNVVLDKYGFPEGIIYHRERNEDYKDVVERMVPLPAILIEDDCESIGGEQETTYIHLKPELKTKIKSITVEEFRGIDYLPDDINSLPTTL